MFADGVVHFVFDFGERVPRDVDFGIMRAAGRESIIGKTKNNWEFHEMVFVEHRELRLALVSQVEQRSVSGAHIAPRLGDSGRRSGVIKASVRVGNYALKHINIVSQFGAHAFEQVGHVVCCARGREIGKRFAGEMSHRITFVEEKFKNAPRQKKREGAIFNAS